MQSNSKGRATRSLLLMGTAIVASLAATASACGAETAIETVVVTGSHIPQAGLISASPLTTVNHDEAKFEGTTTVETLINNLPAAITSQNNTVSNGADGTATLDLRGLGAFRTLVLVDGKRLPYGSASSNGLAGSSDVHEIPAALVERVEVVTGGASAVYGSDAVAGVVNFILRKDFEGVEIDGQYGFNQHSNGDPTLRGLQAKRGFKLAPNETTNGGVTDVSFLLGANSDNGKGNVTAFFTYEHSAAVTQALYDRSACNLSGVNAATLAPLPDPFFACGGSSTANPARIRALDGSSGDVKPSATGNGTLTPFVSATDAFNFAPLNYFQRPDERYNGGVIGHYSPNDSLDIYTSFLFLDDKSIAQIAPSGAFFGVTFDVNCDNPLLSPAEYTKFGCTGAFGSDTSNKGLFVGRRLTEAGGRRDNLRYTDYRAVFGVKGRVLGDWNYDVSAQYGQNVYAEEYTNDVSVAHLSKAFQVVNVGGVPTCKSVVDGSDPACVPFNVFTAAAISQAAVSYVSIPGFKEGSTGQLVIAGTLSGTVPGFQSPWADSPVAVAAGFEYRHDALELRVDNEFATGDLAGQGGATPSVAGGVTAKEVYLETHLPIVKDVHLIKELSLEAAGRYSNFKPGGDVFTFKYGGTFKPIDDIGFRVSYEHAVRTPNIVELFNPSFQTQAGGVQDLCGTAATLPGGFTAAQCAHTNGGVPLVNYGSSNLDCPADQCQVRFGGNVALQPEAANTLTVGLIVTPTFFDGFSATFDFYDIKINHIIGNLDFTTLFNSCATSGAAASCSLIHRGPGEILFGGSGSGFVDTRSLNLGFTEVEGLDVEANYASDLDDLGFGPNGGIAANFVGTYSANAFTEQVIGDPATDIQCNGRFGGSQCNRPQPFWRHKLRLTWTSPFAVNLSAQWRFVGHVKAIGDTGFADARLPDESYFDISGTYDLFDNLQLRAGVNNVLDQDPPIVGSEILGAVFGNGNTYPGQYDALGRQFFIGGTFHY